MGDDIDILINELCTFKIVHNGHLLKKKSNILSAVFFKRDRYHKNFKIYMNGVEKLVLFEEHWNDNYPHDKFYLLIFIDRHIYEDDIVMNILKNGRNTIIILFDCMDYRKGDFHIDLFPTMVRFFPMFNFKNNPFNCVICIDIDLHEEDYVKIIILMNNKPAGLSAGGPIIPLLYEKNGKGRILANVCCAMEKNKYDHKLLIDFIKNADLHESIGYYKKRSTPFGLGVDEIFLNEILIPRIDRFNIAFEYQISYFIYHSKKYMERAKRIPITTKIIDYIMGRYNKESADLNLKLKLLERDTKNIRVANKLNSYFTKRFSNAIRYMHDNRKKWIERKVIQFIYEYLLDVVYAVVLIHTDKSGVIHNCTLYNRKMILAHEDYD